MTWLIWLYWRRQASRTHRWSQCQSAITRHLCRHHLLIAWAFLKAVLRAKSTPATMPIMNRIIYQQKLISTFHHQNHQRWMINRWVISSSDQTKTTTTWVTWIWLCIGNQHSWLNICSRSIIRTNEASILRTAAFKTRTAPNSKWVQIWQTMLYWEAILIMLHRRTTWTNTVHQSI